LKNIAFQQNYSDTPQKSRINNHEAPMEAIDVVGPARTWQQPTSCYRKKDSGDASP